LLLQDKCKTMLLGLACHVIALLKSSHLPQAHVGRQR
jgi:hypothetical protein